MLFFFSSCKRGKCCAICETHMYPYTSLQFHHVNASPHAWMLVYGCTGAEGPLRSHLAHRMDMPGHRGKHINDPFCSINVSWSNVSYLCISWLPLNSNCRQKHTAWLTSAELFVNARLEVASQRALFLQLDAACENESITCGAEHTPLILLQLQCRRL